MLGWTSTTSIHKHPHATFPHPFRILQISGNITRNGCHWCCQSAARLKPWRRIGYSRMHQAPVALLLEASSHYAHFASKDMDLCKKRLCTQTRLCTPTRAFETFILQWRWVRNARTYMPSRIPYVQISELLVTSELYSPSTDSLPGDIHCLACPGSCSQSTV